MKKYMIVALLPILLQGTMLQASEANLYQVIEPSLQRARSFLKNPMIPLQLEPVLDELIMYVQQGKIHKNLAVNLINDIKKALESYKNKQYSNFWLSWFVSTPQIVKDKVQPALDKVNSALSVLQGNEFSSLEIAGIALGATAAVAGVAGGSYLAYKKFRKKKDASNSRSQIIESSAPAAIVDGPESQGMHSRTYNERLDMEICDALRKEFGAWMQRNGITYPAEPLGEFHYLKTATEKRAFYQKSPENALKALLSWSYTNMTLQDEIRALQTAGFQPKSLRDPATWTRRRQDRRWSHEMLHPKD